MFVCCWNCLSSKTKGPGEEGPPEIIQKFRPRKWPISRQISHDPHGKNRAPFWPFLKEGFWGNIRRPLLLPAPVSGSCQQRFLADRELPTRAEKMFPQTSPPPKKKKNTSLIAEAHTCSPQATSILIRWVSPTLGALVTARWFLL